ncbi:hypothetical protein AN958_06022 [Leucoagaricus sp. SymC.cos]|nr:hypothetical protein AN958_06022 [Leucoagaricus sp. SymC.cos]
MSHHLEKSKKSLFSPRWRNSLDVYLHTETHTQGSRVPSLVWFCLQIAAEFPDQVDLPFKLIYRPPSTPPPKSFRLIDKLLRTEPGQDFQDFENAPQDALKRVDPRLWATVIQIFGRIPIELRTYTLPLNDEVLPLLQGLKNTDTFALITILELPGCDALTDDSIVELKCLHALAALDASNTVLSSHGITTLSRTLLSNEPENTVRMLRGPWGLRILRLKHCIQIDDTVYCILSSFPLLAVVDLRGTKCHPPSISNAMPFSSSYPERALFSSNLALSLEALQRHQGHGQIFSAPKEYQFSLRVKTLCHESVAEALTPKPPSHRGLHWYDADRQRATTYVPMSRIKHHYEDKLMLYRPPAPWSSLESELEKLLKQEAQRESTKLNKGMVLQVSVAANDKRGLRAQEGLQSMTTLALQRRKAEFLWTRNTPPSAAHKSPFVKKFMGTQYTNHERPEQFHLEAKKPLRPISSVKVPEFTENLLRQGNTPALMPQDFVCREISYEASTLPKNMDDVVTKAWGQPTFSSKAATRATSASVTDQREEQRKRRGIRLSGPSSITATSSTSLGTATKSHDDPKPKESKKRGGSIGKKVEQQAFNWKAWASKKT